MVSQQVLPIEFQEALNRVVTGDYIKDFEKVYEPAYKLIMFWKKLKEEFENQVVETIKNKYGDEVISIFIGGLKENDDGSIKPDGKALCSFFEEIFGLKTNKEDIFIKYKFREKLDNTIYVKKSTFIEFVEVVLDYVEKILNKANRIVQTEFNEEMFKTFLLDYKSLAKLITKFLENVLNILPNYSRESFIVWSLQMLTYQYLSEVYPHFKDENMFNEFINIYGYKEVFSPNLTNVKLKKLLTIYDYDENSLGKNIIKLINYVWINWWKIENIFSNYISNLPSNLIREYAKQIKELILSTKDNIFNIEINNNNIIIEFNILSGCEVKVSVYIYNYYTKYLKKEKIYSIEAALNEIQPFIFGSYNIISEIKISKLGQNYLLIIIIDFNKFK